MAQWVANGPCPDCGSRDNRAEYEDGSYWCWGCSTYTAPTIAGRIAVLQAEASAPVEPAGVNLPDDFDPYYIPLEAQAWMAQYELTAADLKRNRVGWSHQYNRMIFPIIIQDHLLAWQGRYFGDESVTGKKVPKWLSKGKIHDLTYILRTTSKPTQLILVEDLPSAIKIQKLGLSSSPLFGSQITNQQKNGLLHTSYDSLVFWLDRDKATEAAKMASRFSDMGFDTEVIITDHDPKEIPLTELKEILR